MSLPGLSLPGREHGVVSHHWSGMRWRGVCRAAGQGKTVGARKFLSPARSVDRPVRQAAGPPIVQSFRQPVRRSSSASGCRSVDRPVRQAAGPPGSQSATGRRPAGPRVRQPAERPAVLIAQHTAGRPAQSGVRSLGRRGTGARGLFRRAAFPRRRITMCTIDTHKKIQTELKKSYTLPCVVQCIWGGRLGSGPTPPRSRARPPAASRPAGPSRGPRGSTPGARRRKPSWGPSAEGKRPAGGGGGGAPCFGWRMAGERLCAPGPGERERPLAGALLPRRAALADSGRGAANRHARARGGRPRAPDQRTTRPLAQGPWA